MGALARVSSLAPAGLALAQAAWDMFLRSALTEFDEPNPNLRHDLAYDKTIRALGRRPNAPLTPEEREALQIRKEVEQLIQSESRLRNFGQRTREVGPW